MTPSSHAATNSLTIVSPLQEKLKLEYLLNSHFSEAENDGRDVIQGLTGKPKSIPPRYFYDDRGSELFEQICQLPEYYPTRTESAILKKYSPEIAKLTGACELVELGSGSSTKTRWLLDAYQNLGHPLHYVPIDVSASILEASARQLLTNYPSLAIRGLVSTYELALPSLAIRPLMGRMVCFLGSTLGNFLPAECDRFFSQVVTALAVGDYFLLGIDLEKPQALLEAAYNDSQGVTAAFNLNVLQHLNRRFQGNFQPNLFEHRAFYNPSAAQIEMHLDCRQSHTVRLESLDLTVEFAAGEAILTEISRKFDLEQMRQYLAERGLTPREAWTDSRQWFGILLCQKERE